MGGCIKYVIFSSTVAKLALKRCRAFQTVNITIRILLKLLLAVWTTAKVYFLPGPIHFGGSLQWLLTQARWAYNHIPRFPKVFGGISDEKFNACLAAKTVLLTFMAIKGRLILADPQPYQGTATGAANKCFHFLISFCGSPK